MVRQPIWLTIFTAILTSITSVAVAYVTFVVPVTKKTAKDAAIAATKTVEVSVTPHQVVRNERTQSLLVIGYCNADTRDRQMEAYVGATPETLKFLTSVTGRDRLSLSVPVPPGYYYRVTETTGGACSFTGWTL